MVANEKYRVSRPVLRASGAVVPPQPSVIRRFVRAVVLDPVSIARDRDFAPGRKLYWLFVNPFFHLAKASAVRRARKVSLNDTATIRKGSLEGERRGR